jgi:alanyl-tRNA synthetase
MTDAQVKQAEETVLQIIADNPAVYAQEAPLPLAKEIQGLRACFDEVRREGEGCGGGEGRREV